MSDKLLFKASEGAGPVEIRLADFEGLVRSDQVPPGALVKDSILTDGRWWTVDNLSIYHKYSATPHPPGPHLRKRLW